MLHVLKTDVIAPLAAGLVDRVHDYRSDTAGFDGEIACAHTPMSDNFARLGVRARRHAYPSVARAAKGASSNLARTLDMPAPLVARTPNYPQVNLRRIAARRSHRDARQGSGSGRMQVCARCWGFGEEVALRGAGGGGC